MFSWDLYNQAPIVGILRGYTEQQVDKIMSLYKDSGLTTIEITMNTARAAEIIETSVKNYGDKLNIGAGTVITLSDLDKAIAAGASFIVTPIVNEEVILKCVEQYIPIFPGAFTPTEVYKAWSLGASMVKVFPTTFLGPDYIKELKAPLSEVKMLATGGVTLQNMIEFFTKGASGVAMAGQLFPKEKIEKEEWQQISDGFKQVHRIFQSIKKIE